MRTSNPCHPTICAIGADREIGRRRITANAVTFLRNHGPRSTSSGMRHRHGRSDPRLPDRETTRRIGRDPDLDQFPAMRRTSPLSTFRRMVAHVNGRPKKRLTEFRQVSSLCSKRLRFLKMKIALAAGRYRSQHYSHLHLACTASGCGHPVKGYDSDTPIIGQALWSLPRIMEH